MIQTTGYAFARLVPRLPGHCASQKGVYHGHLGGNTTAFPGV